MCIVSQRTLYAEASFVGGRARVRLNLGGFEPKFVQVIPNHDLYGVLAGGDVSIMAQFANAPVAYVNSRVDALQTVITPWQEWDNIAPSATEFQFNAGNLTATIGLIVQLA